MVDLVGNASNVESFATWLKDWHSVIVNGRKKKLEPPKRGGSWANIPNVNARAGMVSVRARWSRSLLKSWALT